MKVKQTSLCKAIASIVFLSCPCASVKGATTSFFDGFDQTLGPAWAVSTETSGSSVLQENGYVQVVNGGAIINNLEFLTPTTIETRFQLTNNERSNLKYVLRSDGVKYFAERKGVAVQLSSRMDWDGYINQVALFEIGSSSPVPHVRVTTPLNLNTWYDLKIVDYSDKVDVYFNGATTPTASITTSYSAGNKLAIYNRHGGADGSWISDGGTARVDYISIVPEPSSLSLLLAGGAVLMAGRRRNRG